MDWQTFTEVAYALGVGTLMGVERAFQEQREAKGDEEEAPDAEAAAPTGDTPPTDDAPQNAPGEAEAESAGVRTFAIISLAGYASALVGDHFQIVPVAALAMIGGLVLLLYWRTSASGGGAGITTEVAAVTAGVLGMLCHYEPEVAGALALIITVLLASKRFTRRTEASLRRVELTATLKFLVVILVVLSMLPDRALDPYEVFNPHKVGLLVVLISGLSYVGYFLTKILGPHRGLALTGIVGGLTSSTAVTAAMAQQAKDEPRLGPICGVATIAANATMFVRVLVIVAVLDMTLALRLAWSIAAMAVAAVVATLVLWMRAKKAGGGAGERDRINLQNPFALGPALKFAAFYVVILFVVKVATRWLGDQGLYAAAALSGLADVDAITLSIGEAVHSGDLGAPVGALAITIAVVSNSVTKSGIAIYSGGWKYGRVIAASLGGATLLGLVVALFV